MMLINEMKLAVCSKLPDLTEIDILNNGERVIRWRDDRPISWPIEGLQVCHEAEKLMLADESCMPDDSDSTWWEQYHNKLKWVMVRDDKKNKVDYWQPLEHATYEQRLEALCRVWWPERFE